MIQLICSSAVAISGLADGTAETAASCFRSVRDLYSDTWDAIDDLGRVLERSDVLPAPRKKLAGIFYWTWHQGGFTRKPPFNNAKFLAENPGIENRPEDPRWGATWRRHHWDEPLFGYYATTDAWVLRRHAQLLSAAGIDTVVFDATNVTFTWLESLHVLGETWCAMRCAGNATPHFAYMLPAWRRETQTVALLQLYREIYRAGKYRELWFLWQGKPLILANPKEIERVADSAGTSAEDRKDLKEALAFFTIRDVQPSYTAGPKYNGQWTWLEVYPQHPCGRKPDGTFEMCSAGVAQNHTWKGRDGHKGLAAMNDINVLGRAYVAPDEADLKPGEKLRFASDRNPRRGEPNRFLWGDNFAQQMRRARKIDPDYLFITGWNEGIADMFPEWFGVTNAFPDQFSPEFSRDLEPSAGILKDSFYCQLVQEMRRFRGVRPQRASDEHPVYRDPSGDTAPRDSLGYGEKRYVDRTGRNDIVECFVSHDADTIAFRVECADAITPHADKAWMRLFISTELKPDDRRAHWNHFHFVVNRMPPLDARTARLDVCEGGWKWREKALVPMKVDGKSLTVIIPRKLLGFEGRKIDLWFKWSDNSIDGKGDVLDFYRRGDAAPDGRFLYRYFERNTSDNLSATFNAPPDSARPEVWWHWMNGNVSRDGIVADLDAMAAVGLGGVTIFDAGCAIPPGPLAFNTPEWFDMIKFAVGEAAKRKLRVCLANCSGYSVAGGSWIAPSNAMKTVCYTLTDVEGPRRFSAAVPAPPNPYGFYEDIAVLAWPVPPAERLTMEAAGAETSVQTNGEREVVYDISFPGDYRASLWECRLAATNGWEESADATLACMESGGAWRTLSRETLFAREQGQNDENLRSFAFPETAARRWRLTVAFRNAPARRYTFGDVRLSRGARMSNIANKARFICTRAATRPTAAASDQIVRRADVRDVTASFDPATGRLAWDVPPGTWRVMRIGYAANGKQCHPASANGVGFECDKLAKSGVDAHFDAYLARICDHLGSELAGDVPFGFNNVLVDSWEAGSQNWTQGFASEFARRRGYDITGWLPVLTGAVLDGVAESEKFLADFQDVIAHLFAENFSDELARKCHARGLKLSLEAYGPFPSTCELYGRAEDITMTEFWIRPDGPINDTYVRLVTERAHRTPGNKIIAAESFTAFPRDGRWRQDPFSFKATGDHMYALGVNRIIYHRYAHQPWTNPPRVPGMTMGAWGSHYERTETWWFDQKEWISYQTRCQALLQAGTFVDDCRGGETLWTHRRYADGTEGFFVARENGKTETFAVALPVTGRTPEIWDPETGAITLASEWFESDGQTVLPLTFKPSGATFVMFRPVPTASAKPACVEKEISSQTLDGPWNVSFEASYPDAPGPIVMTNLTSLSTHADPDVRYFAGHATYRRMVADSQLDGRKVILDLGDVKNLATVTVNGRVYPTLWRPPFRVDVTEAWSVTNEIAIRVATLWPNRLIGDERLPADCEWRGDSLVKIPEWVEKGGVSPTGRHTFTTRRLWGKDEPLLPSGLIGPVRRLAVECSK